MRYYDAAIDMELGTGSTVKIGDLIARMNEKKKNGWLSSVSKYTKTIGRSGGTQGSTTLAGVRGKQAVSDDIEWFEDDMGDAETLSALQKGKDLFNEGRYVQAIPVFEDITEEEGAQESHTGSGRAGSGQTESVRTSFVRNEASFYLVVSLFNVLRYREARSYFLEIQRDYGGSDVSAYASEELKAL